MRIHHHDDYPLRATGLRDFGHGIYAVDSQQEKARAAGLTVYRSLV